MGSGWGGVNVHSVNVMRLPTRFSRAVDEKSARKVSQVGRFCSSGELCNGRGKEGK